MPSRSTLIFSSAVSYLILNQTVLFFFFFLFRYCTTRTSHFIGSLYIAFYFFPHYIHVSFKLFSIIIIAIKTFFALIIIFVLYESFIWPTFSPKGHICLHLYMFANFSINVGYIHMLNFVVFL